MADTTAIKKGAVIRHNNDLYVVTDFSFVNPGKGSAFTKTKMKSISAGKTIEITYKSGETVDVVQVSRQTMQYLYKNGEMFSFMNKETYETIDVSADVLEDESRYLKEGMDVIAVIHEEGIVAIQLPIKVQYTVKTAPPAVKGDSAGGNVTKEIVLENDLTIQAPIFIKEGEKVLVNTETGDYGGRVTE
ncbi:MAG: elongation factor P [Candidatus Magasanikbacteria bacterium]|nr:elongation factor P [Candidatus Magasanikbacteria bacterium]|tara:strand:+ start:3869 stop:4435 length:567 start_codon:yes stop_codon:yes gene_type:complete